MYMRITYYVMYTYAHTYCFSKSNKELLFCDGHFAFIAEDRLLDNKPLDLCIQSVITAASGENRGADTTMSGVPRIPTPPPPEMACPVAENWCYTQVVIYIYANLVTFKYFSVDV